jgi:hypothetical protein
MVDASVCAKAMVVRQCRMIHCERGGIHEDISLLRLCICCVANWKPVESPSQGIIEINIETPALEPPHTVVQFKF